MMDGLLAQELKEDSVKEPFQFVVWKIAMSYSNFCLKEKIMMLIYLILIDTLLYVYVKVTI